MKVQPVEVCVPPSLNLGGVGRFSMGCGSISFGRDGLMVGEGAHVQNKKKIPSDFSSPEFGTSGN